MFLRFSFLVLCDRKGFASIILLAVAGICKEVTLRYLHMYLRRSCLCAACALSCHFLFCVILKGFTNILLVIDICEEGTLVHAYQDARWMIFRVGLFHRKKYNETITLSSCVFCDIVHLEVKVLVSKH